LFETRRVEKIYLAMTDVEPKQAAWTCRLLLGPHPEQHGLMRVDKHGKEAETAFRLVASANGLHLIERGRRRGGSINSHPPGGIGLSHHWRRALRASG